MSITARERTKINALLVTMHGHGHDMAAIARDQQAAQRGGQSFAKSWERAINKFLLANPGMNGELQKIARQIDASDDRTIGHYDRALSSYIETGNPAAIQACAGMVTRDALELAVQAGEVSREDAAAGNVDWAALGMDAATATAAMNAPDPAGPEPIRESFQFAAGVGHAPASTPAAGNPAGWTETGGYSSRRASPEWQNAIVVTGRASPYAGMSASEIRDKMQAAAGPAQLR